MNTYELHIFSNDVNTIGTGALLGKHSGYVLIEKDNSGNIISNKVFQTYGGSPLKFDTYPVPDSFFTSDNYTSKKIDLSSNNALDSFSKIALEAKIINQLGLGYDFTGNNCNGGTAYFADRYIDGYRGNGSDVFDLFKDGRFGGDEIWDLSKNNQIKEIGDLLDKFYKDTEGLELDLSDCTPILTEDARGKFHIKIGEYIIFSHGPIAKKTEDGDIEILSKYYWKADGIEIPRDKIDEAVKGDIRKADPLVLDLNGDGINLIKEKGKYFYDLGNDGVAEEIDWISSEDGFLVHDKNNNGKVDNVNELFGNSEIDGYDELIEFDTNGDGKINADDEKFHELKVWVDKNSNGISDSGELKTLSEIGIKELQLTGKGSITGQYDNTVQNIGNVVFEDGRITDMGDVYSSTNSEHNIYTGDDVEVSQEVLDMPNLKGFGDIPDLHIAAMKNDNVKSILEEISSLDKDNIGSITDLTRKLIFAWGNIDKTSEGADINDKDLLLALFRFSGLNVSAEAINNNSTRDTLHQIYSNFENSIMRALLVQTIFSSFDGYSGEYSKDFNLIMQNMNDDFSSIYGEVMKLDIKDNPRLTYNIYQILKEFSEAEKTVYNEDSNNKKSLFNKIVRKDYNCYMKLK